MDVKKDNNKKQPILKIIHIGLEIVCQFWLQGAVINPQNGLLMKVQLQLQFKRLKRGENLGLYLLMISHFSC